MARGDYYSRNRFVSGDGCGGPRPAQFRRCLVSDWSVVNAAIRSFLDRDASLDLRDLSSLVNDGAWRNITAIRDVNSGTILLYVDGRLEDQVNGISKRTLTDQNSIYFGRLHNSPGDIMPYMDGKLDEIYFFNLEFLN